MFVLQKILSSWIMPSGVLVIFLIFLSLILLKKRNRFLSICTLAVAGIMYLMSTGIGTYIFVKPLENDYQKPQENLEADAVVILGGGIIFGPDDVYLNPHALQRVYDGAVLANKIDLPVIITGGITPGRDRIAEAQVMKKVIENMGIKPDRIILEPNARNTYENALYTYKICEERGFKKLLVVTSAVHMKRAIKSFEFFNLEVVPYPTDYRYDYSKLSWIDFTPNNEALSANLTAIHEIIGTLWYKIRYSPMVR